MTINNTQKPVRGDPIPLQLPTIRKPVKAMKKSPYVFFQDENLNPETNTLRLVPPLKINSTVQQKESSDRRVESTVKSKSSNTKEVGFRVPFNKHLAKTRRRKSFKFVMDPLRHLKSPNALTPRCNGYARDPQKKKQKTQKNAPGQRRNSMKFTMDPLRHLKTPNIRIKKKEQKMNSTKQTEEKRKASSCQTYGRRPSMRFTLDPLRNLNYLANNPKSTANKKKSVHV